MRAFAIFLIFSAYALWAVIVFAQVDSAEPPSQRFVPSANDPDWRPTLDQMQLVEQATMDYFTKRDGGQYNDAYSQLSSMLKVHLPFATYRAMHKKFNAKAGQVQSRHLRAVTWYKDPPQQEPGLFVAVDFSSQFSDLAYHCGFLVWLEQPDGSFLLVREEENFTDNATASRMRPKDFERIRDQFKC